MEHSSEVTRLRESIRLSYEAAQRALNDPAFGSAKHEFITKRMEGIQHAHAALQTLVGEEAATKLVAETLENAGELESEDTKG